MITAASVLLTLHLSGSVTSHVQLRDPWRHSCSQAALSVMELEVLYHRAWEKARITLLTVIFTSPEPRLSIPSSTGGKRRSLSHQMDYGSLISINLAEKLLANDPNSRVSEDSLCATRASIQKEVLIIRDDFAPLVNLSLIFRILLLSSCLFSLKFKWC